jgi:signal peptidase I
MVPTIVDGEYILIDKLTIRFDGYHYGDVVVFNPPSGSGLAPDGIPFIKRIIGMPGDTVALENGRVFVTRPDSSPVRIEESYVVQEADGSTAATTCNSRPDCPLTWIVGENEYFVMGDNRPSSQDSRVFGPIDESSILGRAWLRYFPLERVGIIDRPEYPALEPAAESSRLADGARGG